MPPKQSPGRSGNCLPTMRNSIRRIVDKTRLTPTGVCPPRYRCKRRLLRSSRRPRASPVLLFISGGKKSSSWVAARNSHPVQSSSRVASLPKVGLTPALEEIASNSPTNRSYQPNVVRPLLALTLRTSACAKRQASERDLAACANRSISSRALSSGMPCCRARAVARVRAV